MSVPRRSTPTQARSAPGGRRGAGVSPAVLCLGILAVLAATRLAFAEDLPLKDQPHLRRPVAAAWIEKGKLLAVANQRSGSISVVDVASRKVLDEVAVGERLADIVAHPNGRWLLTADEGRHELIVLQPDHGSIRASKRYEISPYPVSIGMSPDGRRITVSSLWSRKVTVFETSGADEASTLQLKELATVSIAFNPQKQMFPPAGSGFYVIVLDAFTHRAAVVDTIIDPGKVSYTAGLNFPPAFEPSRPTDSYRTRRGDRVDNAFSTVGGNAENYFYDGYLIFLGPAPDIAPADRGEQLFYDGSLSKAGWMSCHTCHRHGHTSYQLADTLGDDSTGTPKRIPTLLGTRLTDPWAWNGKVRDLNEQVRKSLETTMHVQNVTPQQVDDITAYLHTLPPPPPLEPATDDPADQERLARGQTLFKDLGCSKCHIPPLTYTSSDAYDVGMTDERGLSKFNPPSLRGVSQGYSFFHDGRAKSLEEIFTRHGHQLSRELTADELGDLLRFLRSL